MNVTIDDASPQIGYYAADGSSGGKWTTNHAGDTYQSDYYRSSFHATPEDSDYMTFTFNGTAVYVYGAKRPNHGYYSASIDGQSGSGLLYGGSGSADNYFEQLLFFSENLSPQKTHTVTLTNAANLTTPLPTAQSPYYLDIDYIIVTTAETGKIYTTIYDDASPAFTYHNMNGGPSASYYNQTNHLTYNISAGFSFSFNGTLVQLLGGVNYDHGNYSVVLDGGLNQVFNGYSNNLFPNTSLFFANNLTQGLHTVSVTNLGDPTGTTLNAFDFDWAIVESLLDPNLGPVNSTNTTTTSNTTSPDMGTPATHSTHTVPIVVGVVVGVVGLAFIAFVLWFFMFRRKKRYQKAQTYDPTMDLNADPQENGAGHPHLDGREVAPFRSISQGGDTSNQLYSTLSGTGTGTATAMGMAGMAEIGHHQPSFTHPGTESSHGSAPGTGSGTGTGADRDRDRSSGYLTFPAAPPSNATSYPASESAISPVTQTRAPGSQNFPQASPHAGHLPLGAAASSYAASSSGATTTDHSGSSSDRPLPPGAAGIAQSHSPSPPPPAAAMSPGSGRHPGSLKSATVSLPYTSRPPTSPPIREQNTETPSAEAGEERMMLPGRDVDVGPLGHHDDREEDEMLPPNYQQATQPLPGQRPDPSGNA